MEVISRPKTDFTRVKLLQKQRVTINLQETKMDLAPYINSCQKNKFRVKCLVLRITYPRMLILVVQQ